MMACPFLVSMLLDSSVVYYLVVYVQTSLRRRVASLIKGFQMQPRYVGFQSVRHCIPDAAEYSAIVIFRPGNVLGDIVSRCSNDSRQHLHL